MCSSYLNKGRGGGYYIQSRVYSHISLRRFPPAWPAHCSAPGAAPENAASGDGWEWLATVDAGGWWFSDVFDPYIYIIALFNSLE